MKTQFLATHESYLAAPLRSLARLESITDAALTSTDEERTPRRRGEKTTPNNLTLSVSETRDVANLRPRSVGRSSRVSPADGVGGADDAGAKVPRRDANDNETRRVPSRRLEQRGGGVGVGGVDAPDKRRHTIPTAQEDIAASSSSSSSPPETSDSATDAFVIFRSRDANQNLSLPLEKMKDSNFLRVEALQSSASTSPSVSNAPTPAPTPATTPRPSIVPSDASAAAAAAAAAGGAASAAPSTAATSAKPKPAPLKKRMTQMRMASGRSGGGGDRSGGGGSSEDAQKDLSRKESKGSVLSASSGVDDSRRHSLVRRRSSTLNLIPSKMASPEETSAEEKASDRRRRRSVQQAKEERQKRKTSLGSFIIAQSFLRRRIKEKREELRKRLEKLQIQAMGSVVEKEKIAETDESEETSENQLFKKQLKGAKRFRYGARIIYIALQWIKLVIGSDDINSAREFHKVAFADLEENKAKSKEDLKKKSGLVFDKNFFKANTNKEFTLSNEVKQILNLNPKYRDDFMVKKAIRGLALLRSFADYPSDMQEKLCKVAWYMTVEPRRVIIREGHSAECFYFVLSGHADVKKLTLEVVGSGGVSGGEPVAKVVATVGRGATFGELALLQNTRRQATVESTDSMQLLVVGRRDFIKIFLQQQGGNEAGHLSFLRGINELKGWPVEQVLENPHDCLFHFFKRGAVIVPDSKKNDWLYIVKSGTCKVLKKLSSSTASSATFGASTKSSTASKSGVVFGGADPRFPQSGIGAQTPLVDAGRSAAYAKEIVVPPELASVKAAFASATFNFDEETTMAPSSEEDDEDDGVDSFRCTPQGPRGQTAYVETPVFPPGFSQSRFSSFASACRKRTYRLPPIRTTSPAISINQISDATNFRRASKRDLGLRTWSKQTLLDPDEPSGASAAPAAGAVMAAAEPSSASAVFVQVALLQPKDVFGFNASEFIEDVDGSTSVTLVSRGAECIMLRKQFFLQHADSRLRARLRMKAQPFPLEETLQENLETTMRWESYKKNLINDIKEEKYRVKSLRMNR